MELITSRLYTGVHCFHRSLFIVDVHSRPGDARLRCMSLKTLGDGQTMGKTGDEPHLKRQRNREGTDCDRASHISYIYIEII